VVDRARNMRFVEMGPECVDALTALFEQNADPAVTKRFDPFSLTAAQALRIATEPRRDLYYSATQDGQLLALSMLRGFDEGYAIPSFGIFVDRECNGQGIGRRLSEWTIERARLRGCRAVRLTVYADNHAARGLFASLGFCELEREIVDRAGERVEKLIMRLDLGG
jgi:ribosomal-protein-alanine N-acetyltransferase